MPLGWRQLAHYVREVHELTADLTRRLDELDAAAVRWVEHDADAARQLIDETKLGDLEWHRTLAQLDASQVEFFDALEGILAAWARLSLLFFPGQGDPDTAKFQAERAAALRKQLGIDDDSLIADRELRNSSMHFDERMDFMRANGQQFDCQRFVTSRQAEDFIGMVPRLMILDTRTFCYLTQSGDTESVETSDLRDVVEALKVRVEQWWRR
jgi:hypothetical protein